jgi:hypothetical protein
MNISHDLYLILIIEVLTRSFYTFHNGCSLTFLAPCEQTSLLFDSTPTSWD